MPSGSNDKRRVVVVGLGSIGRRHTRLLLERTDVSIEVVESNPENLALAMRESGHLDSHADFAAALETRPDVVWLATPTALHARQSIAALEAGAHVFCEKPMSDSVADAQRIKEAAEGAAGIVNVGFYLHFWAGMTWLKRLIGDGKLGSLLHLHARIGSYTTLVNSVSRYQANQPGSLFFDYSHQPDLFCWLLGRAPRSVWTAGFQGGDMELSSSPNVIDTICEFDDCVQANIHLNYVQLPERHYYEVIGDKGWAELDFLEGRLRYGDRATGELHTESIHQQRDDIFRAEHAAFFDAVEGRRPPETSAAEGLISTAICEAAVQSWRSGQRVQLHSIR